MKKLRISKSPHTQFLHVFGFFWDPAPTRNKYVYAFPFRAKSSSCSQVPTARITTSSVSNFLPQIASFQTGRKLTVLVRGWIGISSPPAVLFDV